MPAAHAKIGVVTRVVHVRYTVEQDEDGVWYAAAQLRPGLTDVFRMAGTELPPKLVSAHLNIPEDTLAKFPRSAQGIVPLP
jgi:hypothetical protein